MIPIEGLAIHNTMDVPEALQDEWSEAMPLWMRIVAMLMHLPCFVLLGWIMRENTYLSQEVKIDQERGHKVITSGPYAIDSSGFEKVYQDLDHATGAVENIGSISPRIEEPL